jgi:hypothetical protein
MNPYQNLGCCNAIVLASIVCYVVVLDLKRLQLSLGDCRQLLHFL